MGLRDYQVRGVNALRAKVAEGHRRSLLVAPTGAGKGTIAAYLIEASRDRGRRSLFLAHRRELLKQLHDRVPWAGIIAAGVTPQPRALCQVGSVQTLARRAKPIADLVVVDEAHHVPSETWSKVLAEYPDATVVGLTATPARLDGRGLGDHFSALVEAAKPSELLAGGWLSPFDVAAFNAPELHDVGMRGGDFKVGELAIACNTSVLVGDAVQEYLREARGRRAIAFAVNIEGSLLLRDGFRAAGVACEHVDGDTPQGERDRALERFAAGDVQVITNVALFTEGLDIPAAEVCIMCRPTLSESMHLQMIGRVLRPQPGKVALILDHAGNLLRHGLPDEDREWHLEKTPARVRELHTCPFCRRVFGSPKDDGSCPKCGEIIAPPREVREAEERKRKQQIEGERIDAERIKALRAKRAAAAPISKQIGYWLELKKKAREEGYDPKWVGVRFKVRYGRWPNFTPEQIARAKEDAAAERRAEALERGCECHLGHPPCWYCMQQEHVA